VKPRTSFQKGEKTLRRPPNLSDARGGGRPKGGKRSADQGAAGDIGSTGARDLTPPHRPNRHFTQSRDCSRLNLTGGEVNGLGVSRLLGQRIGGSRILALSRYMPVLWVCRRHNARSSGLVASTIDEGGLGNERPELVSGLQGL
jgi:hypothetical protein